jgi:hypothetical protein
VRDEDTEDNTVDNEAPDILSGLAHEPVEELGTCDHRMVFPGTIAFGKCQQCVRRKECRSLRGRGEVNTGRHLMRIESEASKGSEGAETWEEFTTTDIGVTLPEKIR